MKLIDTNAFQRRLCENKHESGSWKECFEEIKLYYGVKFKPMLYCSSCGHKISQKMMVRNYCPNCGLKMEV